MDTISGIYENGVIHPTDELKVKGKKNVIITFLDDEEFPIKNNENNITPIILSQLLVLEEDWNAPGMEKYDKL